MLRTAAVLVVFGLAAALAAAGGVEGDTAWLGVFVDDVDGGIELVGIVPGGPAGVGGLRRGDVLLRAGGRALAGLPDLEQVLSALAPGEMLAIDYLREGHAGQVEVRVGRREEAEPPAPSETIRDERVGWVLVDVTPDLRRHFGAPAEAGVLVARVVDGRPAARAGLRVGDVLVSVDDHEIHQVTEVGSRLREAREAARPWPIALVRGGEARIVELRLPAMSRTAVPSAAIAAEIERLKRRIAELERQLEQQPD